MASSAESGRGTLPPGNGSSESMERKEEDLVICGEPSEAFQKDPSKVAELDPNHREATLPGHKETSPAELDAEKGEKNEPGEDVEALKDFLKKHGLSCLFSELKKILPVVMKKNCVDDVERLDLQAVAFFDDPLGWCTDEISKARERAVDAFQMAWDFWACREFLQRHQLLPFFADRVDQMPPRKFWGFDCSYWGEKEKFDFYEGLFCDVPEAVALLSEKKAALRHFCLKEFNKGPVAAKGGAEEGQRARMAVEPTGEGSLSSALSDDLNDFVSCHEFPLRHDMEILVPRLEALEGRSESGGLGRWLHCVSFLDDGAFSRLGG